MAIGSRGVKAIGASATCEAEIGAELPGDCAESGATVSGSILHVR